MGILFAKPSIEEMSAAKQVVDQALKGNRVMVFSKSYCPFCHKAKRALKRFLADDKVTVIELENRNDCSAIQQYLGQLTGGTSVPRVFIDGEFIGGGDDVERLANNGKLEVMLKEKGIM